MRSADLDLDRPPHPSTRRRPRRRVAAVAVTAALGLGAVACSSSSNGDAATGPGASASSGTALDGGADGSTVPTGPRTVTHAMGTTEVPAAPERVVVLDSSMLDSAIALGLTPVGATEGLAGGGLPSYLGDDADGIEIVGETNAPNLEAIADLQPDLIIGAKVRHEALYETLSGLAPTVFSESSGTDWTSQVRLTGEAIGRADQAEVLLDEFEARATEVGQAIGADGTTAVIVRFIPGQIRLYGPKTFSGSVLTAVGFDLVEREYDPAYGMAVISPERIDLVDADVVFATNPEEESDGQVQSDRGTLGERWTNLPAVAGGRQFDILDAAWMTGIGPIGANRILGDLEQFGI